MNFGEIIKCMIWGSFRLLSSYLNNTSSEKVVKIGGCVSAENFGAALLLPATEQPPIKSMLVLGSSFFFLVLVVGFRGKI